MRLRYVSDDRLTTSLFLEQLVDLHARVETDRETPVAQESVVNPVPADDFFSAHDALTRSSTGPIPTNVQLKFPDQPHRDTTLLVYQKLG